MASVYAPPINELIAGLFGLLGLYATARGVRLLARGVALASPLDLVRGIRACVVAFAAGACVAGFLLAETGFLVLGALVLGEELYETGLVCLVIRAGDDRPLLAARRRPR